MGSSSTRTSSPVALEASHLRTRSVGTSGTGTLNREEWREMYRAAVAAPLNDLEMPVRPADGRERLFSVTLEHAGEEGAGFVVAYMHDITESKKAETALRESEARLSRAQSIARVGNWEIDLGSH
jgi:PAS domain-containing protein